eukprot:227377_1
MYDDGAHYHNDRCLRARGIRSVDPLADHQRDGLHDHHAVRADRSEVEKATRNGDAVEPEPAKRVLTEFLQLVHFNFLGHTHDHPTGVVDQKTAQNQEDQSEARSALGHRQGDAEDTGAKLRVHEI